MNGLAPPPERKPYLQHSLAVPFLSKVPNAREQQIVQRNHPGQLPGCIIDYRKPRETGLGHAENNHAQGFVSVGDDRLLQHIAEGSVRVPGFQKLTQLLPGNHTLQSPLPVHHRIEMLPVRRRFAEQRVAPLLNVCIGRKGDALGSHHFADEQYFQRVCRILTRQMKSSTRDFLGQNRALQEQYGGAVCQHRRHQQGQQHRDVVRQFEGK